MILRYFRSYCLAVALLFTISVALPSQGQVEDPFGDQAADPVKLFERGQSHHARGEYALALAFYEKAIRVRPEFPEAEFQRGNSLISLGRLQEGEEALRRAIELRKEWSLPYSTLGALLLRLERERDAETALRQALQLDKNDDVALRLLAQVRLTAGDTREALELARRATNEKGAPAAAWIVRAMAERENGEMSAARSSIDHVLQLDPENRSALLERAEIHFTNGEYGMAIEDLRAADRLRPGDKQVAARLAFAYERSGDLAQAEQIARAAGLTNAPQVSNNGLAQVSGTAEEIEAANSDELRIAEQALQSLLDKNPNNAVLLARLGEIYRTEDPKLSLEYYRRAVELQPENAGYATGYSAALVKARRFHEAVVILRRIMAVEPDNYAAHSNLATALYSLKLYGEALPEYEWLLNARPDLAVIHYFIATAHDNLGQYQHALEAYKTFLVRADINTNQLEIEKVKLRLPTLRRQVQLKEGVKRARSK